MKNIFKIVVAGVLCAAPSIAQACSCKPPPAPKIALGESAAVFVGRVTSVETRDGRNTFQFAVSKKWKGVQGDVAAVASNDNSAACGIVFDKNRDYLVYAFKIDGDDQLQTNLCTRTKRAADAADDLAELGAPQTGDAVASNGVKQLNIAADSDPLVILNRALQKDKNAQTFRVNWKAPTGDSFSGTALYNRKNSTLKTYSRSQTDSQISVSSILYSGVTDNIIRQLASTEKIEEFFRTYAQYGVTKKDVGSKTIKIS